MHRRAGRIQGDHLQELRGAAVIVIIVLRCRSQSAPEMQVAICRFYRGDSPRRGERAAAPEMTCPEEGYC